MSKFLRKSLAALAVAGAVFGCSKDDLMKDQASGPGDGSIGVNVFVPRLSKGTALNNTGDLVSAGNGFDLFCVPE